MSWRTGKVFGDAPNVAARLEVAAEPGSVLVKTNVHRQIAGRAHRQAGVPPDTSLCHAGRPSPGLRRLAILRERLSIERASARRSSAESRAD